MRVANGSGRLGRTLSRGSIAHPAGYRVTPGHDGAVAAEAAATAGELVERYLDPGRRPAPSGSGPDETARTAPSGGRK